MTKAKRQANDGALVVALTGGIASGKTSVSRLFDELGVPVIDTDIIARQLVEPGEPLLAELVTVFGQGIVGTTGRLRRRKLRNLIFSSRQQRDRLEALMHPAILKEARRKIREVSYPYCLLVIPLFTEIGGFDGVDRVLLVDVPVEQQLSRLESRDRVSREQAQATLSAQASREERLAIADDVIDNSGEQSELRLQVESLHQLYLKLGRSRQAGSGPETSDH